MIIIIVPIIVKGKVSFENYPYKRPEHSADPKHLWIYAVHEIKTDVSQSIIWLWQ